MLWNQWQLSRGMDGRLRLESVATLVWNTHEINIARKWYALGYELQAIADHFEMHVETLKRYMRAV
ncbi:hypothetical protein [Nitrincola sp. A-D6]|uniref:hypothetical protein n=1 Tax=Nitrincola sp. A-D6 TaxID=1545442 RepID=UPI001364132E|nr:hypothetical protein [Nitrincola sp. A-D6]